MLKEYKELQETHLSNEQHMEEFAKFAQDHFEGVSPETDSFRRRCVAAGFSVVFHSPGMSDSEAIDILESPEMQLSL